MEKPQILLEMEMKEELAGVVNKWCKTIPAMHIYSTLDQLSKEVSVIADRQLEEVRRKYEESLKEESENDS